MTLSVLALPADGDAVEAAVPTNLIELQSFVKGTSPTAFVETVHLSPTVVLACNEDGIALRLPVNEAATRLFAHYRGYDVVGLSASDCARYIGQWVLGDAVLFGNDGSPEVVGLTEADLLTARAVLRS